MLTAAAHAEPAKLLLKGGVLSGQLTAIKLRRMRSVTYQVTSAPRRLPPPSGLCNLETGPETFQIVADSTADVAALKPYLGKDISLRANETSCAREAGQLTDAVVTKWTIMKP